MSAIVLGREQINEGVALFNLETLESAPENAAASEQRTATLPPLLGLTPQQMDIISAGAETCESMNAVINQQRQEVMRQLEAANAAADTAGDPIEYTTPPSSSSGVSQGPGAASSSSRACGPLSSFQQRQQDLEKQQQLAARLKVLMAKQ
jgi:hypothetical protein